MCVSKCVKSKFGDHKELPASRYSRRVSITSSDRSITGPVLAVPPPRASGPPTTGMIGNHFFRRWSF